MRNFQNNEFWLEFYFKKSFQRKGVTSEATWISPSSLWSFVAILNLANLSFHSGHLAGASKLIDSGWLNLGMIL